MIITVLIKSMKQCYKIKKINNSSCPVSNKEIKFSTKRKHKILHINDNDNDNYNDNDNELRGTD